MSPRACSFSALLCLPPQQHGFLSFGVTVLSPAPQARQYFRLCGQCSVSLFVFCHRCGKLPQTQRFKATYYLPVLSDPTGLLLQPPQGQRQGIAEARYRWAGSGGGRLTGRLRRAVPLDAGRLLAESSSTWSSDASPCVLAGCQLTAGSASLAEAPCPASLSLLPPPPVSKV